MSRKKKIIIWGTGNIANKCCEYMQHIQEACKYEIVAVCDNKLSQRGSVFWGNVVKLPNELASYDYDIIVIANQYEQEIKKQIVDNKLCDISKVYNWNDFFGALYVNAQYHKRKKRKPEIDTFESDEKSIVYTALFGRTTTLRDPIEIGDKNIKYICFTDNKQVKSDVWDVRYIQENNLSSVLLARKIKIMPWLYFDFEGVLYWVDSKLRIIGDVRGYKNKYMKESSLLLFLHHERECICDETSAIIPYKPDIKDKVIRQTAKYLEKGYPINNGLYETGFMVRDFNDVSLKPLMEQWWSEVLEHTYRDQISLPFVCWQKNFEPDVSNENIRHNDWVIKEEQ